MTSVRLTSARKTNTDVFTTSGEVVVATIWLGFFLAMLGITLGSEALSSAIKIAALY